MKIIAVTFEDGAKSIQQAGDFKLGRVYRLKPGSCFYAGKLIQLDWICANKNIVIDGIARRSAAGTLFNSLKYARLNFTIEDLELQGVEIQRHRVRQTAAKLLKLGKKEAALKLLKTLKDA